MLSSAEKLPLPFLDLGKSFFSVLEEGGICFRLVGQYCCMLPILTVYTVGKYGYSGHDFSMCFFCVCLRMRWVSVQKQSLKYPEFKNHSLSVSKGCHWLHCSGASGWRETFSAGGPLQLVRWLCWRLCWLSASKVVLQEGLTNPLVLDAQMSFGCYWTLHLDNFSVFVWY